MLLILSYDPNGSGVAVGPGTGVAVGFGTGVAVGVGAPALPACVTSIVSTVVVLLCLIVCCHFSIYVFIFILFLF